MPTLSAQAKAIATGIVALLLQIQVFVGQGGVAELQAVTLGQWITIAVGTLGSYGVVYAIPNTPAPVAVPAPAVAPVVVVPTPAPAPAPTVIDPASLPIGPVA